MARVLASLLAAGVTAAVVVTATPAYAAAPASVTALTAVAGSQEVALSWALPAEEVAGVTVVYKAGTAPTTTTDGTAVALGPVTGTTVTGLVNGTTYGFSVFTRNAADEFSAPVSVTKAPVAVPTVMQTTGVPITVLYNRSATLKATLKSTGGAALADTKVDVYRRQYGQTTYHLVYRVRTNASGVATYVTPPLLKNTRWMLKYPGDAVYGPSTTPSMPTNVAPRVTYTLSAKTVEQNVAAVVKATVVPSHAGRDVALQQFRDGAWRHVRYGTLSSTSTTSFRVVNSTVGARYYRVLISAHADHVTGKTAVFGIKTVTRTLRQGMSGADVTTVQKRLAALKYDVGTVNGYFGYDTTHATMAFQKVNGLRVTGAVDATTRAKLSSPVRPRLRYSRSGNWVEADLTKQVLYYVRDGVVARILDISSGNGELFTVEGETQRATTPTGSFRIFHRIDGMRVSRLGSLWKPAYFASGGYAIHGSGFVPAYPDSHGCIRITNPAMDRLFPMLTIGLPVFVYRS
jgi:peptidoglycan hydrolase-like protein with peptidoglycan-binding domain